MEHLFPSLSNRDFTARSPRRHGAHGDARRTLCEISVPSAVVRKNVAPASSRQTVLLTQRELSRLTCRRDAGATILSHDLCLRGETGRLAAAGSLSESHHEVPGGVFIGIREPPAGPRARRAGK